ncbi:MAG: septum formation initiator family protein [Bacteroidetes bacterium]|jgi:cell division protein FtsB|nr:septum formation initiator family protein [Bacteroidota bacterium]MBL0017389.1 septum formation initiator family protein [Bacteroidota bacterium]MBP6639744.1 septum formation initiator family protein [Bacteroidia bacterium]MBP6722859.1 septum formation initiator family protein [Bacteroidia bacterium]MBP8073979.1 septum formation initiator family protein [Bacteroidia bacterium]
MKKFAKILPYVRNFYVVFGGIALIWVLFFDRYNFLDRLQTQLRIKELRSDLAFFKEERDNIEETRNMLESDMVEIERFARERYMMKRANEDLFLISNQ